MNRFALSAAFALAFASVGAQAALHVQRHSAITDDFGGSLTIDTTGSMEHRGGDLTTQALFNQFHPRDQNRVVSGNVTRERSGADRSSTFNGSLSFAGTGKDGNPANATLQLQNFKVARNGDGPKFSGTLIYNGQTVDASQVPAEVKGILHHVLRVFRFD